MNPDTKLTLDQIKIICRRHGIAYRSHERITAGFTHEVHLLNNDMVLKLFNTTDSRHFETESATLALHADFPKPELIASHASANEVDRSYVIMTYIEGHSLGSKWHLATEAQREVLIEDICRALKTINQINPSDVRLAEKDTWEEGILRDGKERIARLVSKKVIDSATADKTVKTLEINSYALANSKLYPDYWDIHFDNFIVDDNFKLQALIDLENVWLTALDYPLFVVHKQTNEPKKYLREADEQYADKRDYKNLMDWYRQYYPEMFEFDNLDSRLKVYQLLDTLHLLLDWSHVPELHTKLRELLA